MSRAEVVALVRGPRSTTRRRISPPGELRPETAGRYEIELVATAGDHAEVSFPRRLHAVTRTR